MSPDLQKEFQLLSLKAKQQLKEVPASGSYRHLFSFWTMPSFAPSSRWTVFTPARPTLGHKPFATYTVWRSDMDLEKFRSPVERLKHPKDLVPTFENETVWLAENVIKEIEHSIHRVSIPIILGDTSVAGCDGTGFEFGFGEMFCGGSLHWWEGYPKEWESFTQAVLKIAANLEARRKGATL